MDGIRELTVRIEFQTPCLGDRKRENGDFVFSRSPTGQIIFLASWHRANMVLAAKLLGRHHDSALGIMFDIHVDGKTRRGEERWHRIYHPADGKGKQRYSKHEAFHPGDVIGLNCVVPNKIGEEDFWTMMNKAGQYRGISPWKPGEYGFFEVVSIRPRKAQFPLAFREQEPNVIDTSNKPW